MYDTYSGNYQSCEAIIILVLSRNKKAGQVQSVTVL